MSPELTCPYAPAFLAGVFVRSDKNYTHWLFVILVITGKLILSKKNSFWQPFIVDVPAMLQIYSFNFTFD